MKVVGMIAAAIAIAVPSVSQSAVTPTGLHGFVRRGLIMPICYENVPCDEPAAGIVLVFTPATGKPTRVRTNNEGFYRVRLAAGRYLVKTGMAARLQPAPAKVWVRAGRDIRRDFYIDTGIQ